MFKVNPYICSKFRHGNTLGTKQHARAAQHRRCKAFVKRARDTRSTYLTRTLHRAPDPSQGVSHWPCLQAPAIVTRDTRSIYLTPYKNIGRTTQVK